MNTDKNDVQGDSGEAINAHRYHQALISVAYKMLADMEKVQDVVQDVYLKVLENGESFSGNSSFKTYLYRIVINRCIDIQRKDKRWRKVRELLDADFHHYTSHDNKTDSADLIRKIFKKIPYDLRIPLILAETEDMTYEEIAETLQIPLNTVRTRIFRCRERLRKELKKMGLLI